MFVLSYRTASRLGPPPHHPTGVALRAAREGKGRQGAPKVWLQIFFKELNRIKAIKRLIALLIIKASLPPVTPILTGWVLLLAPFGSKAGGEGLNS